MEQQLHGAAAAASRRSSGASERRVEGQCVIKESGYSTSRRSASRRAAERDGGLRATLARAQTLSWGGQTHVWKFGNRGQLLFSSAHKMVLMSTNALTSRGFYILSLRLYPCALVSAGSEIRPPRCASPVAKRWAIMGHCDNDTPGTRYAHAATINAIQLKSSAVGSDHAVHRDPGQPHWHSRGAPAPTKAPDALQYVRRINAIPPMFGRLKAIQTRIKSLKSCTAGGPVMCAGRHVAACQ